MRQAKLVQTIQINPLVEEDDDEDMLHFSRGW